MLAFSLERGCSTTYTIVKKNNQHPTINKHSMRRLTLTVFICLSFVQLVAQQFQFVVDDADGISPKVYAERRHRLIDSLPANGVAVILSADVRNRQNDVDYEYRQNSDMLYLTGFPFPYAALVLCKEPVMIRGRSTREIFFVRNRVAAREQWQGVSPGPDEAKHVYGLSACVDYDSLHIVLLNIFSNTHNQTGADSSQTAPSSTVHNKSSLFLSGWSTRSVPLPLLGKNFYLDSEIKKGLLSKFDIPEVITPIPALASMRMVKDSSELRLIRKAVDITVQGHLNAMKAALTVTHEYEIEAAMEYTFKRLGAEDVGYPSIVGSSYNACILHYNQNRRKMNTGNLVLADCGAEYHGYTADVTRTFPINGNFTAEQRAIYNLVLEAQDSGIAACRPNAPFKNPHTAALSVITRGLIELGIITTATEVKKYFMHGTSHYLGLDVHDVGNRGPLLPNTVITVEPGIYIAEGADCDKKWWNIGVRIEDDILITNDNPENLSGALPRTVEAIQSYMRAAQNR